MTSQDIEVLRFLNNEAVQLKLTSATQLSEIKASEYDIIFYVGEHSTLVNLPSNSSATSVELGTGASQVGRAVSLTPAGLLLSSMLQQRLASPTSPAAMRLPSQSQDTHTVG
ncbi:hypothetical protein CERSUDRAFT_94577 [Gelatoporia subvermispora B]|uniref:Uncharacterized protein n=1 Tax=Ceriporiopsis subvermispora (strain B) TaxID=914234 RepID=M2RFI8_CERS8|nr:hypothetical protein CERSUDRAFT_94577 [Gelatoporia subvermispora B]